MKLNLNPKELIALVFFILISQMAGIIGSIFTFTSINSWYALLNKPFFSPPNWVFAPVWIILYLFMGIAAFLIWRKGFELKKVKTALSLFTIQLILNSLWSIIFFGLKNPFLAFLEIIVLWIAIALMIKSFYSIEKKASYLQAPYILWVSFAALLNFSIWFLNS
ncbi:MAG: TspO/MBR family protein [Candidatus Diapherotrites archaeon]